MHIFLKNSPANAKVPPDPISRGRPNKKKKKYKISGDMESVPDPTVPYMHVIS